MSLQYLWENDTNMKTSFDKTIINFKKGSCWVCISILDTYCKSYVRQTTPFLHKTPQKDQLKGYKCRHDHKVIFSLMAGMSLFVMDGLIRETNKNLSYH